PSPRVPDTPLRRGSAAVGGPCARETGRPPRYGCPAARSPRREAVAPLLVLRRGSAYRRRVARAAAPAPYARGCHTLGLALAHGHERPPGRRRRLRRDHPRRHPERGAAAARLAPRPRARLRRRAR